MLNREKMVKYFNAKNNKRLSPDHPDLVSAFEAYPDMGEKDFTALVDGGYLTERDDITNPDWVRQCLEYVRELPDDEPKVREDKKVGSVMDQHGWNPAGDSGNPFGMMEQLIRSLVATESAPIVDSIAHAVLDKWVEVNSAEINKIKHNIEWTCEERGGSVKGVVHESFETICKLIAGNEPVLLVGPAGTGKNFTAKQVADRFNLKFYFTNSVTQEHKLIGFIDAYGNYHDTQFYHAFTEGGLFFFDEMDVSDPEILKLFNTALENGYMDFPTGRQDAHPDFRVIGAANTWGTGASFEYIGHELDGSTLDRFMPKMFDYSPAVEESMTSDLGLLDFIRTFRKACSEYGVKCIASYRAIRRMDKFREALGYEECLRTALLKNLEHDDMAMLLDRFSTKADDWSKAFVKIARG